MKNTYTQYIDAILAGESIISQAKLAGVNMNTLRRILIKHPNYDKAKAEGKLRPGKIEPKLRAQAETSPAVADVVAGMTLQAASEKHGVPIASLRMMVNMAHPDVVLKFRGKSPNKVEELVKRAEQRALAKAQELLGSVQPAEPETPLEPTEEEPDEYPLDQEELDLVLGALKDPQMAGKIVGFVRLMAA